MKHSVEVLVMAQKIYLSTVTKRNTNIIDCNLKTDNQIFINFGKNIPHTAGHQMAIVPTLLKSRLCTTWGKSAKRMACGFRAATFINNLCKKNCSVYIQCKGDIVVVDMKQLKSQFKNSNFTIMQSAKFF